jgi:hypothetical protein
VFSCEQKDPPINREISVGGWIENRRLERATEAHSRTQKREKRKKRGKKGREERAPSSFERVALCSHVSCNGLMGQTGWQLPKPGAVGTVLPLSEENTPSLDLMSRY